eukprot:2431439-Pyramimonas_sp.AAC.1
MPDLTQGSKRCCSGPGEPRPQAGCPITISIRERRPGRPGGRRGRPALGILPAARGWCNGFGAVDLVQ